MQEQQQVGFGSQILHSIQCNSKGRHHKRKVVFFQALPELAKKTSNSGNLLIFFRTSK